MVGKKKSNNMVQEQLFLTKLVLSKTSAPSERERNEGEKGTVPHGPSWTAEIWAAALHDELG
jgi:hypothetical protein